MEKCCDILLGGEKIGRAEIEKMGLYYGFSCRCQLSGEVVYRLVARCGDREVNLGVPVPEKGEFQLKTRIPMKKLGSGAIWIEAVPKKVELEGKFVPLSADEPFRYLKQLEQAHLQVRDGKVGLVIPE